MARYWGYLRSANTPLIVRSSLNLWVPVLLLVLAPVGFRSPLRFWKIPPVDLAAHCVPVSIFHQRCARALDLPANLFVSLNKLLFTAIESFSWFPDRRIWPIMDSAGALTYQGLLENNNSRLDRQEEQMLATGRAVQALVAQVSELTTQIQQLRMPTAPLPPPVPPALLHSTTQREPRLPAPEAYNGEPDLCRAFLVKCSMFFSLQTADVRHRGVQGGVSSHPAVWEGGPMGNGGVGEPSFLLLLVSCTFWGDEESLRPRGSRAWSGTQAGRSPPGWKICLGLLHRVPNPGGRVQVERGGAVGHVPAWVSWPDPEGDVHQGVAYPLGWIDWVGSPCWLSATATWPAS